MDQQPGRCGAVLASVEEAGSNNASGSLLEVRIVEDYYRSLASELKVYALEIGSRTLCYLHASPNRSSDRDHLRDLVLDHCASSVTVTCDDVEDTLWQKLACDFC